ncbi:tRNA (N(6)-L-threonylcarbamoyladenosine(37)-C(2))-methylthiotransferase MtaB [bacterium]|nr:tRNA (N(6)-L-threonylcarbamoyladenosine(37)-C(2))-methylthiotransferase MtaB [bacterium]
METFFIKNMGCKANQLEGAIIREKMINAGYILANKEDEADIFILNSCTVTHKSDKEALYIISHAKKKNPKVKTILTGCFAQIEKENLLKNPNIDIILGNDEKLDITTHLSKTSIRDIMSVGKFNPVLLHDTNKTRANLKIQDGCDNRCSYCIIPFARGKNRSANIDFILDQIKIYEQAGFKEIVLTGIHIGQWGFDFKPRKSLLNLLQEIEKTNIKRYRLGSLNPLEINGEMIEFLKNSEKFCPHFHLSLQSLCDETLKRMNRFYSVSQTMDLIERLAEEFKLPFLGSDIIAGFAGETETEFATTVENLKKSKLSKIHTFPYSIRKGTVAETIKEQLSDKEKTRRANIIKEISALKYSEFLNKNIGQPCEILIEKINDKKTGYLKGMTKNYLEVLIDSKDETLKNTLQTAVLQQKDDKFYAEIKHPQVG